MFKPGDIVEIQSNFLPPGTKGIIIEARRYKCDEKWFGYDVYISPEQTFLAAGNQLRFAKEENTPISEASVMKRYMGNL